MDINRNTESQIALVIGAGAILLLIILVSISVVTNNRPTTPTSQ